MEAIVVALIAQFGAALLLWFKLHHDSAKREKWLEQNVGSANGQGNITAMLERSLQWQGRHEAQDRRIAEFLGVPDELLDPYVA